MLEREQPCASVHAPSEVRTVEEMSRRMFHQKDEGLLLDDARHPREARLVSSLR